jgi:hypothetical protein
MDGSLRVDIPEGQALLVLVDDLRRNLARDDLRKDAAHARSLPENRAANQPAGAS